MEIESFNELLGEHLRRIRKQRGLSLAEVESMSQQEFRASVVGAYERGERAVSAQRLCRLAELYDVPLRSMLPHDGSVSSTQGGSLTLDTAQLQDCAAPEAKAVMRYVRLLQARRHDWAPGPVFSLRGSDVLAIAGVLGRGPDELLRRLDELKVRVR